MPTASDYFQTPVSKYFRAGDFTKELVGTIQSVDRTEFKNDDGSAAAKPVLHFQDLPQALVLNKTNFTALALMFGEDTNDWTGEKVALYPSRVDFKGKTMPTIKVRRPQKAPLHQLQAGIRSTTILRSEKHWGRALCPAPFFHSQTPIRQELKRG